MSLQIYNTLTQRKEPFEPLVPGHVRMYACGVTVYDLCHLGHARQALIFDVIRRYLEYKGYHVTYVRNFTDVDDKIINRARELGRRWDEVARGYIEEYYRDMDRLGIRRATIEPKATEHIPEMIGIIKTLLEKGYAYQINGDVYFEVQRFPEYGKLSGRKAEQMLAGARIEIDPRKKNPLDFALWKRSKEGEPAWESPWGPGRPGWHIECSAMSMKYLGESFDIHGGGADLIFPHHENEIAQSESCTGKPFARYWVHNGFVSINQEKMSKSLGNFFTIQEVLNRYRPEAVKLFLLSAHYRGPLDFSDDRLEEAKKALDRFVTAFEAIDTLDALPPRSGGDALYDHMVSKGREAEEQFQAAMDDDFNTAAALGVLFGFLREVNLVRSEVERNITEGGRSALHIARDRINRLGGVLGLFEQPSLRPGEADLNGRLVELLLDLRAQARSKKDWATADAIRERLNSLGIEVEDTPQGSRWHWRR